MSYILEALKKSDAQRKRSDVPTLDGAAQLAPSTDAQSKSRLPWILSGVLGVAALALAGVLLLRPETAPPSVAQLAPPAPPSTKETQDGPQPEPVVTSKLSVEPEPIAEPEPVVEPATQSEPVIEPIKEPEPVLEPEPEIAPVPDPVAANAPIGTPEPKSDPVAEPEPLSEPEPMPEPAPAPKTEPSPVTIHKPSVAPAPPPAPKVEPEVETAAAPKQVVRSQKPTVIMAPKSAPQPKGAHESAKDHVDRAWSSIDKGMYNQALRDLNRAVKIEPNFADAWFARGWTNEKSGKELSAIGDYARTIAAQPDHAFALFSRGYLNLYVGSPRAAVTDFVRTQGVAQDHSLRLYSHLWLYLSRTRADQPAFARLSEDAAKENLSTWPGPLVKHFLGQIEEGRVLAAIEGGDKAGLLERRCTGYFFLGISALNQGDQERARSYFEKTLATGAVQFRQYDAAKRELDSLNR